MTAPKSVERVLFVNRAQRTAYIGVSVLFGVLVISELLRQGLQAPGRFGGVALLAALTALSAGAASGLKLEASPGGIRVRGFVRAKRFTWSEVEGWKLAPFLVGWWAGQELVVVLNGGGLCPLGRYSVCAPLNWLRGKEQMEALLAELQSLQATAQGA